MQQIILILGFLFSSSVLFSSDLEILNRSSHATGYVITHVASPASTSDIAYAVAIDQYGNSVVAGTNGIDFALARYTPAGALDTSFGDNNNGYVVTDMGGTDSAHGVAIDGNYNIIAAGTNGTDFAVAWYTSDGILNTDFGVLGDGRAITQIGASTTNIIHGVAIDSNNNVVVVGTDGVNLVVARYLGSGAYAGQLDRSFNNSGDQPGVVTTAIGKTAIGYAIAIDANDCIVVTGSSQKGMTTSMLIVRYLPTGVVDTVVNGGVGFGTGTPARGWITKKIDGTNNIGYGITINSSGKILVCGVSGDETAPMFTVAQYTVNGTRLDTAKFGSPHGYVQAFLEVDGVNIARGITLDSMSRPVVCGQSGSSLQKAQYAVIRYTTTGTVDTTFDAVGYNRTTRGMQPNSGHGIAINSSGQIVVAGSSTSESVNDCAKLWYFGDAAQQAPLMRVFQQLKKSKEETEALENRREGFRSITPTSVIFFASPGADAGCNQVAQAIAMQDSSTYVIALNGATSDGGQSEIFINEFDTSLDPVMAFNTTGQATLPHYYQNEFVRDIVTFTTPAGVNKAILAGYMTNSTLGITGSVLWQYNLSTVELDSGFGGFNGNPTGIAYGDGYQIHVVGQQTNSRIIAGGLTQYGGGLLLGYTADGILDASFGNGGYQSASTGATGIYTHAIDAFNRIVIAFNDGSNNITLSRFVPDGSELDATFNSTGTPGFLATSISGISGNSNMKVIVDGSGNIVVAGVNNSGVDTVIQQYSNTGAFNIALTVTSADLGGITSFTLARLLVNTNGNVIVVGWDNNVTQNELVIFQTVPGLTSLDSGFNNPGTPGYLKYIVSTGSSQIATDALIDTTGQIVVVGSED